MAKPENSRWLIRPYKGTPETNVALFRLAVELQQFDKQLSFLDPTSGAYVLYGKGHNYHEEELDIAKGFAKYGVNVVLTSEQNMMLARRWVYNKKDHSINPRFAEGTANGIVYEQKTTNFTVSNFVGNVIRSINHATDAKADIAVIYDRYGKLHSTDIEKGMDEYLKTHSNPKMKAVVVFDKDLNIYEHHWNK